MRSRAAACCAPLLALFVSVAAAGPLADCPPTPNCVATGATDPDKRVPAWRVDPSVAWEAIVARAGALVRSTVTERGDDYLHVEVRSALFGFVDDLELRLDRERGVVEVRSASRTGKWDLGVNRRRVESLAAELAAAGLIRPLSD